MAYNKSYDETWKYEKYQIRQKKSTQSYYHQSDAE